MLNQVTLVGRLVQDPTKCEEHKIGGFTMAIPRAFKNKDGEYDTDFIPVTLPENIIDNCISYCKKGDIVGVKGRLEGNDNFIEVKGEKVTFLSSKKE